MQPLHKQGLLVLHSMPMEGVKLLKVETCSISHQFLCQLSRRQQIGPHPFSRLMRQPYGDSALVITLISYILACRLKLREVNADLATVSEFLFRNLFTSYVLKRNFVLLSVILERSKAFSAGFPLADQSLL